MNEGSGVHEGIEAARATMRRALALGAIAATVIGVVAAVVGWLVGGAGGLASGLIGAALAFVYLGVTALALALAGRFPADTGQIVLIGGLLAGWLVKVAVFLAAVLLLRQVPWLVGPVLFWSTVATVLASLVIDSIVVGRARIPVDPHARDGA